MPISFVPEVPCTQPRIGPRSIVTYHDNYIHQIPEETETFSSTTSENGSVPKTEVEVLPFKVDLQNENDDKYKKDTKRLFFEKEETSTASVPPPLPKVDYLPSE